MEVNRLNLNVNCGDNPRPKTKRPLTLDNVINWIKSKNYPTLVEEKLIAKAKTYPNGSLDHFRNNIQQHVQNAAKSSK